MRSLLLLLLASTCAAQPRIVDLKTDDGEQLKLSYFAASRPGPGILLLHQCDADRKLWDPLARMLADAGMHVVTFDYRGFGESGGARENTLTPQQRVAVRQKWPADIELAYSYLLAQPGISQQVVGAGGGSCGVNNAIQLARKHAEIKALMLLAGPTDRAGREFLRTAHRPVFTAAADDDQYGPEYLNAQWFYSMSGTTASRYARYPTGGHAAVMFRSNPELPRLITQWFGSILTGKPAIVPRTNGTPLDPKTLNALDLLDRRGAAAVPRLPAAALMPEWLVNNLGYEQMQTNPEAAVAIMKLNTAAYPGSPNAHDSLGDAYAAVGQNELAVAAAKKAIDLLATSTDPDDRKAAIRQSAEQKIKTLSK